MKKIITLVGCVLICISSTFAKNELYTSKTTKKNAHEVFSKSKIQRKKRFADAKDFVFSADKVANRTVATKSSVSDVFYPHYVTQSSWFTWYNLDNNQSQYCEIELVTEGWSVKEATVFLFDNDMKPHSSVKIENLPDPSHISIDSERTNDYFIVRFYQDLEPKTWVVNNQGEVVFQTDDVFFVGNDELMRLIEKEEGVYGYEVYDMATMQIKEDIFIPFPDALTTPQSAFYSFLYYDINGKEYLIISTIKGILSIEDPEDPNFFNPGPDCMFNLYLYDPANNYSLAKEINIPLESTFDRVTVEQAEAGEGGFGIHYVDFGAAAVPFDLNISTDKFNSDDKIEILFNVFKEVYMGGESTMKYVVANEDGEILSVYKPEHYIADVELNRIEGEKDEMIIVSLNELDDQQLEIVDITSFQTKFIMPARLNGYLASTSLHRVKEENQLLYLVNIVEPEVIETEGEYQSYGHIFKIDSDVKVVDDIKFDLNIMEEVHYAINFSAAMTNILDYPTLLDSDEAIDYAYTVDYFYYDIKLDTMVQAGNRFYIGKENQKAFFAPYNDKNFEDMYGRYYVANFLSDNITGEAKYMYLLSNTTDYTVFYELPLEKAPVSVENPSVDNSNNLFASYNGSSKTVEISDEITEVKVFDINGSLIYAGYDRFIPASNWSGGVYMLQGKRVSGTKVFNKVLVF